MVSYTATALAVLAAFSIIEPTLAHGGFNFSPSLTLFKSKRAAARRQEAAEFGPCQTAISSLPATEKVTYFINADHSVVVNGMPSICITELNTHNALPNIADLNKWEGWGKVLNATAIETGGMGNALEAYLETVGVQVANK